MKERLFALILVASLGVSAWAAPIVTLGPPLVDGFSTVNPGSVRVDMLNAGDSVDLQLSVTVHPFCFRPILFGLGTTGDDGTFTNQTGTVLNGCGGDTSVFDVQLAGDGLAHTFDIEFLDVETGVLMVAIPVELFPGGSDTDGDGVADVNDNCVQVANADQRDTDADNIGNFCDPDVAEPNDCVVNVIDLGVYKNNFFQRGDIDTDNNGDGNTNALDLGILKSQFFGPPGPSGLPNACMQLGEGDVCDPGASLCGAGLTCCYPCGVPGCNNICEVTCDPNDPACVDGCLIRP
jgi:hypothetical protein